MVEKVYMIGGGISGVHDIPIRGFYAISESDILLVDTYTSVYDFNRKKFVKLYKSVVGEHFNVDIIECSRSDLEVNFFDIIKDYNKVSLLVPGDPMIATTHSSIVIDAKRRGINVEIINASSVISAIPSRCGLISYNFGKVCTLPLRVESEYPADVVRNNLNNDMHSLVLLEVDVESGEYVTIWDAVDYFMNKLDEYQFNEVIAVIRIGFDDEVVVRGKPQDFRGLRGKPPQSLIIPASMKEIEREFLNEMVPTVDEICGELD